MKKISFSGYYGMQNYGDDLFAVACALGAEKFWGSKATVVSPKILGIESYCDVPAWLSTRYSSLGYQGALVRGVMKAKALLHSDIVLLGGGSTLSPNPPKLFDMHLKMPYKRAKLAAIGVSVEPVESNNLKSLKGFLDGLDFLSLRDKASYDYLSSLNVTSHTVLAADLAGTLLGHSEFQSSEQADNVIGLAPCNYESYVRGNIATEKKRNESMIAGVARYALEHGSKVKLFSLNNHKFFGDDELVLSFQEHLESLGVDSFICSNAQIGAFAIWHEISTCSVFLSVRLHGAITAYLTGVPFVLVEYHKKCTEFLNDIGQQDILRLHEPLSDTSIYGALAVAAEAGVKCAVTPDSYRLRAETNFTAFRDII
ncbi:polysaccharide pyruvyl transferase family protein [Stutzerimonas chloritidismutans]|uniref:polysaccharide pyruvyl transferase family protein n=1 Tax=Stutzerimonas chloritidismutans TaxID=203192 RepID=UPI003F146A83